MYLVSNRTRRRLSEVVVAIFVVYLAWIIQLALLSQFRFVDICANLPMAMTIVWGLTFGSRMEKATNDELRVSSLSAVFIRQLLSGSPSGLLIGAYFAALAASVMPVYPVCYPLIGWIAGYFSLRNFNQAAFLCIPLTVLLNFLAEMIMALQLNLVGRPDVFSHLMQISFPEAFLSGIIAPVLFIPMRGWFQYSLYLDR
jgi:rod shape-determining protein MreD